MQLFNASSLFNEENIRSILAIIDDKEALTKKGI